MQKLGADQDSREYWARESQAYAEALEGDYHQHRLGVIRALIPKELFTAGKRVFEFGCGDAVLFPDFLKTGARTEGIDISPEMIVRARKRLSSAGYDPNLVKEADVTYLRSLPSASLDALLSFNVLAYLTDAEEQTFYQEAARVVKPGGYLVVTHSNELFDLFSLNGYTLEFFKAYFVPDRAYYAGLEQLLPGASSGTSHAAYNVRENPLAYRYKLARFGFEETSQAFINLHVAPPALLDGKSYPDTLAVKAEERWKLMFVCSTFGSASVRLG